MAVLDDVEALIRADPHSVAAILKNGERGVARQPVIVIKDAHAALIDAVGSRALSAGPKRLLPVLQHGSHFNILVAMRTGNVLKLAIDIAAQAAVGAHPDAAALARRDAPRGFALQAFGLAGGGKFSVPQ